MLVMVWGCIGVVWLGLSGLHVVCPYRHKCWFVAVVVCYGYDLAHCRWCTFNILSDGLQQWWFAAVGG